VRLRVYAQSPVLNSSCIRRDAYVRLGYYVDRTPSKYDSALKPLVVETRTNSVVVRKRDVNLYYITGSSHSMGSFYFLSHFQAGGQSSNLKVFFSSENAAQNVHG
jgi:hypothetical protein